MKEFRQIASKSWGMIDRKSKALFYLSIFLFFLTTCLRISGPVFFSFLIESIGKVSIKLIVIFCGIYALIFCLSRFLEEFRLACYIYFEQILQKSLILNTLSKYFSMPFQRVRIYSSSETSIIVDRGLGGVRTALYNGIFTLFPLITECLLLLTVIAFKTNYLLSVQLTFLILIFLYATFYFSSKTQVLQQKWFSTASKNYQIMSEGIRSFENLRSFKQTDWMKKKYEHATNKFIDEVKLSLRPGIILGIIQGLLLFLIFFVATTSVLNIPGPISEKIGLLVMVNGLLLQVAVPLLQFSASYRFFIQGLSSAKQLFDMIETPESPEKIPHELSDLPSDENITIQDLKVSNLQASPLYFKNLVIPLGKITILSGASGIGKSTLAKCIAGLVDYTGVIKSTCSINDIYYLHQHVDIFDLSFRENIIFGNAYDDEKFLNTVRACGFSESEISELSQRSLGEGGENISGGQSQRIGLARMLYHDAKIMILDEPTSGLNDDIVHIVISAIKKSVLGLTCIIVTHDQRVKDIGDYVINIEDIVTIEK